MDGHTVGAARVAGTLAVKGDECRCLGQLYDFGCRRERRAALSVVRTVPRFDETVVLRVDDILEVRFSTLERFVLDAADVANERADALHQCLVTTCGPLNAH